MLVRPEVLAAITVTAVLIAGALTKLGYAWSGMTVIAVLCLAGGIIEHVTSGQQRRAPSHA